MWIRSVFGKVKRDEGQIFALKAIWIYRSLSSSNHLAWHISATMFLKKNGLNLDIVIGFNTQICNFIRNINQLPLFYCDVFESFLKCNDVKSLNNLNSSECFASPL